MARVLRMPGAQRSSGTHVQLSEGHHGDPGPVWVGRIVNNQPARPYIRCECGSSRGLANHRVFGDGIVTPEFECDCGWRAWIQLRDYYYGEFVSDLPKM